MYAHFYHLDEEPFNLTPDPKFQYVNESTREAMAAVLHGIKSRKGFITLIGEAGTGKTTLLKRILDEIEGETSVVFVFNPGVSFDELLGFICMELGIATEGCGRLQLLERLNAYLLDQLTEGRNVVVMIDEAQTLSDGVLEELRLLSNLETAKEKILQILLTGQPELEDKLRRPGLRQLRQRIAVRATLKPVRGNEIAAYVESRLRSAGAVQTDFFSPGSLRRVWKAAGGIPRVVNVMCDNAMMLAFAEGKKKISTSVMNDAIRDLAGRTIRQDWGDRLSLWFSAPSVRYVGAALVALAIVVPFALSMVPMDLAGVSDQESRAVAAKVTESVRSPASPSSLVPPAARPEGGGSLAQWLARSGRSEASRKTVVAGAESTEWGDEYAPGQLYPSVPRDRAQGDAALSQAVIDSIRRAEIMARSTAARLYASRGNLPDLTLSKKRLPPAFPRTKTATGLSRQARSPITGEQAAVALSSAGSVEELAAATEELANALESLAGSTAGPITRVRGGFRGALLGPGSGQPVVGELVRIMPGDSVWSIAEEHYGDVGPMMLKSILDANPGIRNPRKLGVGDQLFLPFYTPERMVSPGRNGGYRVLLSSSPDPRLVRSVEQWLAQVAPAVKLETETSSGAAVRYRLYATGLASREAAVATANRILAAYDRLSGHA
ncbi:MAG: AAA family ATPase [Deltaproteobacteria bacterium]